MSEEKNSPRRHPDAPYEKALREQALKTQDEGALAVIILADFAKLSDEEKTGRVVADSKQIRALEFNIKSQRDVHKQELMLQARGRKVDAITALTMERLRRRCDQLEAAARAAGTEPPAEKIAPTPGKVLMNFQAKPTKLTAQDLILAIEDELGVECTPALKVFIEEALTPSS